MRNLYGVLAGLAALSGGGFSGFTYPAAAQFAGELAYHGERRRGRKHKYPRHRNMVTHGKRVRRKHRRAA